MKLDLKLGVELEVEIKDDPAPNVSHTSRYVIFGSYPKHHSMGNTHHKHGAIISAADKASLLIETHYDNTINDGVEWIGKPMSLEENKKAWGKLLTNDVIAPYIHGEDVKETEGNGYGIHDVGMHVHVSGEGISPLILSKLTIFINNRTNLSFIEYMAGRKLNKFCKTQPTLQLKNGEVLYHSLDCTSASKRGKRIKYLSSNESNTQWDVINGLSGDYCCSNALAFSKIKPKRGALWLTPAFNAGDFEIRIFKSAVSPKRFNMNLDFVVAMIEFCSETNIKSATVHEFGKWMSTLENRLKYTDLFVYMRKEGYAEGIVPSEATVQKMIEKGTLKAA